MKRVDLRPTPSRSMAAIVEGLNRNASKAATVSHGTKDMGVTGDLLWTRSADGRDISVREVDEELEAARIRIDDAEATLVQTGERLTAAEGTVSDVRAELDGINWDALGAEVYTEGPPPPSPTIGKALWVSPTGRVFRAVEC